MPEHFALICNEDLPYPAQPNKASNAIANQLLWKKAFTSYKSHYQQKMWKQIMERIYTRVIVWPVINDNCIGGCKIYPQATSPSRKQKTKPGRTFGIKPIDLSVSASQLHRPFHLYAHIASSENKDKETT